MQALITVLVPLAGLLLLGIVLSVRVIKQYEEGVLFRLGCVIGERKPGFRMIIPFVDVLHRVFLRIVTMPIQSLGSITRDNVSVDVSAVPISRW
jgi:regulator of protease activity HflC (stomatin/prohibitin superfamily)